MMCLAVSSATGLPSLVTFSLPGPLRVPWPSKTGILCLFISHLTPPERWPANLRERPTNLVDSLVSSSEARRGGHKSVRTCGFRRTKVHYTNEQIKHDVRTTG